jgi:hypothetical protein
MTDSERVENMATALEWASLEERKALEKEKTKKRMEEEIKNRPVAEEQGKKVEELLRDIEKMHVVEKEKATARSERGTCVRRRRIGLAGLEISHQLSLKNLTYAEDCA